MVTTQTTPTLGNLFESYKQRNGFPIATRKLYDHPFEKPVTREAFHRYEIKKYWAYQGAVEDCIVKWGCYPPILHVDIDRYPDIYYTYQSGDIRFHAEGDCWHSMTYTSPSWGQLYCEANKYLCMKGHDYGTLVSIEPYSPPFGTIPEMFDDGVLNLDFVIDID